jgi:hypothetical protein
VHHLAQCLPLGQRRGDESRQGPESLRLGVASARTRSAIKSCLDLLWKGVKPGMIVWGCSQQAIGDGDQRDRPRYRLNVPDLIRIESSSLALFVIDVNGPAVASETGDPLGLPVQFIGHQAHGRIRKVGLSGIDDHSLCPKVLEAMGVTGAVIGFVVALVINRDVVKDGWCAVLERFMVLFLEFQSQCIQALCACADDDLVIVRACADIGGL